MIEFIPFGKENRIQKRELMKLNNIQDEKVFNQELARLRKQYIIKSDAETGGYWRPDSKEELLELIKEWKSKVYDNSKRIMVAYKELEEMEGKQL